MELKNMTTDELLERRTAIVAELDTEGADLDALEEEMRSINEELELRKAEAAKKAEIRMAVANGAGEVIRTLGEPEGKEKEMDIKEIRGSLEYKRAYGNYLKSILNGTPDDSECRALLSTNASSGGQIPVPTVIDSAIQTAWEKDEILSRVKKTFIKGNHKVPFELTATPASEHLEGAAAPEPEEITVGIVELIPKSIKKWILISDEVLDLSGDEFVDYIYDELTYRIVLLLREKVIDDITALPQTADATHPEAAKISGAPSLTIISDAYDQLSDEASNVVVIMNKLTRSAFIAAQVAGNFSFDPFQGLPVLFSSALPAYSAASAGAVYAIVGDLQGEEVNYPNGEAIRIKWDDTSRSEEDLVKVVGRQFAAHGVIARKKFALIAKA